ncbi:MAG: DNA translocase FtsK [Chloroflexi bacterium ADurb.Bin325]|nr:MAG: DNA translocase FtsK [Chloroflexi bacterium ADurb.Bin325]
MSDFSTGTPATTPRGPEGAAHLTAALLQATLSARRIGAMVSLLWDGPQLWAYACSLALGEDPERVERLAGALALAAGADAARVARDSGRLIIEIPKPAGDRKPLRARRLEGLTPPSPTAVALGIATGGRAVWFDLADANNPHLLIAGTTGSGKTVALHWLLYRLALQNAPEALRMVLLDPKRGELSAFERLPHLLHPVTSTPIEMGRLLTWATDELDRRLASGKRGPRLLLVCEELADLQKTNPEAMTALARIAQIGRGLGVHLVGVTQQPGAKSLGDALANFPARLLGRVASATLTYGAAGRAKTAADTLLGKGDFLLLTADGTTRVQLPLLDGRHYAGLPRAATPASLEGELPAVAYLADLTGRDPRGGQGRRELTDADYAAISADLAAGAKADDLRKYGIGYDRGARIVNNYREGRDA